MFSFPLNEDREHSWPTENETKRGKRNPIADHADSACHNKDLVMKVARLTEGYVTLREGRVWKLLAADLGPLVIALLQSLFNEEEKNVPVSVAVERVTRDLEVLKGIGYS